MSVTMDLEQDKGPRMTLNAITFAILYRADNRLLASALIAPDAEYAGVLLAGGRRVDRVFAAPDLWADIEQEVAVGLPTRPLAPDSAIATLLTGGSESQTVQWQHEFPVEIDDPEAAADTLDLQLRQESEAEAEAAQD
jgi:hypothetical protein